MTSPRLSFEVLADTSLAEFCSRHTENRRILSLTNDFEEGKWRANYMRNFILDNITLTALSAEEREKAIGTDLYSALEHAVSRLRIVDSDKGKGSEIAEIILYGIMRQYFNAIPVVPKIFYKQNDNDNAKGADSVHICLEEDGDFSLWLGEAKFYNSIDDNRLDDPVNSVLNSLEKHSLRKETSIVSNIKDLELLIKPKELVEKIKNALRPETSIDKIRSLIHIPILLLHECSITANACELTEEFKNSIIEKHRKCAISYFDKLNEKNPKRENPIYKIEEIKFHLILLPVPNKSEIVSMFYKKVNSILS